MIKFLKITKRQKTYYLSSYQSFFNGIDTGGETPATL